jgi:putative transposase
MAHRLLRRDGHQLNHKRIRRLWREEGLRRPVTCRKRRRVRPDSGERLTAQHPNQVWAIDFSFDETPDGPTAEAAQHRLTSTLGRRWP